MTNLTSWIMLNESLLSGLAAMIVLAGVVLSPLGLWMRRWFRPNGIHNKEQTFSISDKRISAPISGQVEQSTTDRPVRMTLQALTAPSEYETRFAISDGVRIAYNERGQTQPNIIFVPGIISHLHIMSNLPVFRAGLDLLSHAGRVLLFDKRGMGLSDPTLTTPTLAERVRDIDAVMTAAGATMGIVIGFSEGGPLSLSFAHANPHRVQGLILVGAAARWVQSEDYPIGLPQRAYEKTAEMWGTGEMRKVLFPSISQEEIDDATYMAFEKLVGNRTTMRQNMATMIETDVRSLLPEIHVPTLVVHFTGDLAVPVRLGRALAEGLPNAEFLEVKGVDHADFSQSPIAVARILSFIEQYGGAGPSPVK